MEQQIVGDDGRIYRVAVGQDTLKRMAAAKKKSPAKKAPAKKSPAKKKAPAKKAPAKKSPAKQKAPAKRPGGGTGQMIGASALSLRAYETDAPRPH